jgi:hypothetical protein
MGSLDASQKILYENAKRAMEDSEKRIENCLNQIKQLEQFMYSHEETYKANKEIVDLCERLINA